MRLVVLCCAGLLTQGCSYAFVQRAPAHGYRTAEGVSCTEGYGLPALDTVIAGSAAYLAVDGFTHDSEYDFANLSRLGGGIAAITALPFIASAVYGYIEVEDCNAAAAAARARQGDAGRQLVEDVPR